MANGLSMNVIGVRKNSSNKDIEGLDISKVFSIDPLHDALGIADFTILAIPLNKETHDLIDAEAFKAMKPSGMLINMPRGPNVNRSALEAHSRITKLLALLATFIGQSLPILMVI